MSDVLFWTFLDNVWTIFGYLLDIFGCLWTYNEDGADNDEHQAGDGLVLAAVAHGAGDVLGDGVGDGLALKIDVN